MQGWEEEEEEEEEGETGAEVILLTESDHFIYLQRGKRYQKHFLIQFLFSC